ncbi:MULTISPECIES: hypothetical protein [unclassified Streptomyces]|uniref:hypothetical protein n=1 Tax=unclassified Streptomyces TaxID=2593676 RepID=UPI002ED162FD|nr:hypothetical protein OH827_11810 [Streptomyces sp. NBC_00891]WSY05656.1 hypothetical protein OG464_11810 [Streptomyces sp. NBC_00890]WSZ07280.1 hypothetical protein OG704_11810 [Streptomyces sp. NBC_00869]WSZ25221.1 hypothetical protein OG498_21755 [Streptomyces sp. NBC_00870]
MSVRTRTRTRTRARIRASLAVTAVLLATATACSGATTSQGPDADVPYVAPSVNAAAADAQADAARAQEEAEEAPRTDPPNPGPEAVRDAFAGLQATYYDSCEPGHDCAYFLGRINSELTGLAASMKADDPAHFSEPLKWLADLDKAVADDGTGLEGDRDKLIGTRDRINQWMQGHPEDYR